MASSAEHIGFDKIINYKRAIHIECQLEMVVRVVRVVRVVSAIFDCIKQKQAA